MARWQRPTRSLAWAWAIPKRQGKVLCNWAEPTRESLVNEGKPQDDAVMVHVALIPAIELDELIRREKAIAERERRCAAIEYRAQHALGKSA